MTIAAIICGLLGVPALMHADGERPLPGANLVPNASFEQAGNSAAKAKGWDDYYCGYNRSNAKSFKPDVFGKCSCKINSSDGAKGFGGALATIMDNLPEQGEFEGSLNLYVNDYVQGIINNYYVTVEYTDGAMDYNQGRLNPGQIKANLGVWKKYDFNFKTKPDKRIKKITYWLLTGKDGDQGFIGTVYFDEPRLSLKRAQPATPCLLVGRTGKSPVIDANKDDVYSQSGVEIAPFYLLGGAEPAIQQSRAYVTYDDENLYIYASLNEDALNPAMQQRYKFMANEINRDSNLWADDCVEIFLAPGGNTNSYYHFVVNSRGALYDARCKKNPDGEATMDAAWNSSAKTSARVDENAYAWTAEIAIPFRDVSAKPPANGDCWRLNICREEKPSGENSHWAPTSTSKGFHDPEHFGEIIFGGKAPVPAVNEMSIGLLAESDNEFAFRITNSADNFEIIEAELEIQYETSEGAPQSMRANDSWRVDSKSAATGKIPFMMPRNAKSAGYRLCSNNRLLYSSPGYPVVVKTPFIMAYGSSGQYWAMPIKEFYAVQDDVLYVPVALRGLADGKIINAELLIEVPAFLKLIPDVGNRRSGSYVSPQAVSEKIIRRENELYRRYCLSLDEKNFAPPAEAESKRFKTIQLLFKIGTPGTKSNANKPYAIFYQLEVNGITNLAGQVGLNLLEPFTGKKNDQLIFHIWSWFNYSQMGKEEASERINSLRMSGFNRFFNQGGGFDQLMKEHNLNVRADVACILDEPFIASHLKSLGLVEYLQKNPRYRTVTFKGETRTNVPSPAHLLEKDSPVAGMLKKYVKQVAGKYPSIELDYEAGTISANAIGFDSLNLEAFRAYAHIDKGVKLTPAVIGRDYKAKWTDFRNYQVAEKFRLIYEAAKEANPACAVAGYSGYESDYTREHYGINWKYVSPYVDFVDCGYGRSLQAIKDTLKVIGNKPLIGGELIWNAGYDFSMAEINLFRRLTDCGGGVLVFHDASIMVDNRFLKAISRVSSVAADFQAFFTRFEPDENAAIIHEGDAGNVTVLKNGVERLVFLFNAGDKTCRFRIGLKDIAGGATGITYWTKKKVKVRPELEIEVEPKKVEVVYVAMPRKTPKAPEVAGAIQKWAQRLRNIFCRAVPPEAPEVASAGGWPKPLLRWSDSSGARNYYIAEYSRDAGFPILKTVKLARIPVNFALIEGPLEQNVKYYWRVRAVDVISGAASTWSETGEFVVAGEWR
ncbi:carbohydrate-binding family 9-like protein [Patescibacteria group bacterium]|nr:carbohydrate-binding family 9-like protein [Patescibacteria group bacterium]